MEKKILLSYLFGSTYNWVEHHLQTKYLTFQLKREKILSAVPPN